MTWPGLIAALLLVATAVLIVRDQHGGQRHRPTPPQEPPDGDQP